MMKAIFGVTGVPSLPWRSHERLLDLWRLWPINKINLRSFWVDISLQNSSHNTILVSSKHWQATADLIPARSRANLFSFRPRKGTHARAAHTHLISCGPPNDPITERAPTRAPCFHSFWMIMWAVGYICIAFRWFSVNACGSLDLDWKKH